LIAPTLVGAIKLKKRKTMQTLKMYSIRDQKAGAYHAPFYQKSHGEAERAFHQVANDPKSTINQYPTDFDLYYIGEFDDETGKVSALATPQHIMHAASLKRDQ
jgi:uncharacterized protein